ncbi:Aste57867_14362 [Aphanomyces stellatus]|uniref:Aste57867_14362 protein n=1 Tax=Aphanomyces stellatus TaxID=120398 RepID=A0A485L0H3_9STRA|nr:hypothetical protein As57867_014308 [Aphanomyces stellatus]VFT91185.1 Aste57867_14362 [Aphanomyces stellatus]
MGEPANKNGECQYTEFTESGNGGLGDPLLARRRRAPRIIDRSTSSSNHSLGTWNIRRLRAPHAWRIYLSAPFHTLVNMSLYKVLLCLTSVYLLLIVSFALLYLVVDPSCKMEINTFPQSFIFSVSTLFTIGFGTGGNDVFFNSCGSAIFLITAQTIVGVFVNAIAFGIFYARFARGQSRAATISVSAYACVQKIRGALYFTFQTCEMRKHQLAEAHIRCYAILHKTRHFPHQVHHMQSYPMRLQQPDDDLNAWLILALPTICVHRLDAWSPLTPPAAPPASAHNAAVDFLFPEPPQRAVDVDTGTREDRYRTRKEPLFDRTVDPAASFLTTDEMERLLRYWDETQMEVVVLVEGIDAATSATTQMRHSYKPCDVLFNQQFVNCVFIDHETGAAIIDFNRFDSTVPLDLEAVQIKD